MSEVFELVIKYHSLIIFIFGMLILIGSIVIYFNNPITIKTISKVISTNCNQNILNKWTCDLNVKYNDPLTFKPKKTDVTLKNLNDKIDVNDNVIIDTINNVSFTQIIFSLIIGGILIHSAQILYLNRKNKTIQKYIGAASIINII
jgi:hypothetical protein|tara:strand:- start:76 stop:513 length:438 start_codon:yes stop_codon:yes gene_type:complete